MVGPEGLNGAAQAAADTSDRRPNAARFDLLIVRSRQKDDLCQEADESQGFLAVRRAEKEKLNRCRIRGVSLKVEL